MDTLMDGVALPTLRNSIRHWVNNAKEAARAERKSIRTGIEYHQYKWQSCEVHVPPFCVECLAVASTREEKVGHGEIM